MEQTANQNIYPYVGKWKDNEHDDIECDIHYFVTKPLSIIERIVNKETELVASMTITVFENKKYLVDDDFTLDDGNILTIVSVTPNNKPVNRLFKDLISPQLENISLELE